MKDVNNPNLYWKTSNIVEAWQFDPFNCKYPIWKTPIQNVWDVTISEGVSVFIRPTQWYVTERIGSTTISYILNSKDFNNIMEAYDEEEHRADQDLNQNQNFIF